MIARCTCQAVRELFFTFILAAVLAITSVACRSSSTTATAPTPVKCQVALSPSSNAFASTGGAGSISVSAQPECAWSATAEVNWIGELSPTSGQGSGQVGFQVPANPSATARQGHVIINGAQVNVQQEAAPCQFEISPRTHAMDSAGGAGSIVVSATDGCSWSAFSSADWIAISGGNGGIGSGTIAFQVAQNTGAARTGALTVAGQLVTVTQASGAPAVPGCTYLVESPPQTVPATGGSGQIAVTAAAGCAWTAQSNVPWITIAGGNTGSGNGTVTLVVAPNSGGARNAILTIAGHVFAVSQAGVGSCSYSISPTSQSIGSAGGAGSAIAITTTAGCIWSASSGASWIAITSGASGSGNGTLTFTIAANAGGDRKGTLLVAGHTFTVTQAAAPAPPGPAPPGPPPPGPAPPGPAPPGPAPPTCEYTIVPTSQSISAAGGDRSVAVSSASGCTWTATSNTSWIAITSDGNGVGNGVVTFTVAANSGGGRTGTLTIGGQTFTLTQAAACTYSIAPPTQAMTANGGAGSPVFVTTAAHCAWAVIANDPWLTVTSGASGTGPGSIGFTAATNTGGERTGTLTIADRTFTVTQAAAACAYSITPTSQSAGALGGVGTPVAVMTAAGCAWTATSNHAWLTITSGMNGSGNGSVGFTVGPNAGSQREGTLTIAGQTVTVTQAAAVCSYTINPTAQTSAAAGGVGPPVAVTTMAGCAWTATANEPWLTVTSGATGTGNGSVSYTVAANTGSQRIGTLTIAGQTFTVTQPAAPCQFAVDRTSQDVNASGGGGGGHSVAVSTSAGCAWTAISNNDWITIRSGASGIGDGSVRFNVAPNTGGQRIGTLAIAGHKFTVTQEAAACSYSIKPMSATVGALGSPGMDVAVATASHCAWTATSNAAWIIVSSGHSGTGNGTVRFSVVPNVGDSRTGTLQIGGQTFTVKQDDDD